MKKSHILFSASQSNQRPHLSHGAYVQSCQYMDCRTHSQMFSLGFYVNSVLYTGICSTYVLQVAGKIDNTKANAQKFLEDQLTSLSDVYDLAIVSYALQLAGSPQAGTAWNKLNQKSQTSGKGYQIIVTTNEKCLTNTFLIKPKRCFYIFSQIHQVLGILKASIP